MEEVLKEVFKSYPSTTKVQEVTVSEHEHAIGILITLNINVLIPRRSRTH